ncbi:MAG: lipopolysaccharide heptosyltransferase II [Nitrospira sp.]|nr:lipopolysaccharide heptosyltransferase II [Nitrospira sp.]
MRRKSIQRLVVRAPNWIGDAVMCEPALRGLRSLFPEAELTVLAKSVVAELFIGYPGVDRVLVYDSKGIHAGLAGKWTLAGTLRRHQFDLAVLFQNAFEAAFITWLAGIARRYGYATDGRVFFLTDPVAVPDRATRIHQVGYYWNLLKPLGLAGEPSAPALAISADEERTMESTLAAAGIGPADVVIGVNPGSTYGSAKRWLPERFAEAARRLIDRVRKDEGKEAAVMILGAKGEESLGNTIATFVEAKSVVLSGTTTIRELMAATKRCRLLLTNDTGPMHIAAAFGVPVVAVFGPTDWRTTSPYGQEQSIVREPVDCAPCFLRECPIDHRCMTRVPSDRVYEAAVQQLDRQGARGKGQGVGGEPLASGLSPRAPLAGVLNPDPGYIRSSDQFELFPGVAQALSRLKQAGARLIVVTNQSGVARGFFSAGDLDGIHAKLRYLLGEAGVSLDAVYVCPHHPDDGCDCRKPNRGLIDRAVGEQRIDLSRSYLIGDHPRDIDLAKRVGSRSILVTTGATLPEQVEGLNASGTVPDRVAFSLTEAVDWLLIDARSRMSLERDSRGHLRS